MPNEDGATSGVRGNLRMAMIFNRVLLTGAAGGLGKVLRKSLTPSAAHLRLSDREGLTALGPQEEVAIGDLADADFVLRLVRDVDAVVHMGGAVGSELPFEEVLQTNIRGLTHLYEACRVAKVRRVIWGSSNHAIGFYPRSQHLDAGVMPRPDSLYGVSKLYGEAIAQYYWDKFSLETVSIRIGSCFPKPTDLRMLSTWQSYRDFSHLIDCCLRAPRVEHTIVYGVSNNDSRLWDNRMAAHLGYQPVDNAESFRAELESSPSLRRDAPCLAFHGGDYALAGHAENLTTASPASAKSAATTNKQEH
jgi:uronate dehydrogenase